MGGSSTLRSSILRLLVLFFVAVDGPLLAVLAQDTAQVRVRIEGEFSTIFEGDVTTSSHTVTPASSEPYRCDGTNGRAFATPVPTATSALDDAARIGGFTWDGIFESRMDDYVVSRIADTLMVVPRFWGHLVGYRFTGASGCKSQVRNGDDVLWAFDAWGMKHFLTLAGPAVGEIGQPFLMTVTDGGSGNPVSGARVGDAVTDENGIANVTISSSGSRTFKAELAGSLRSNSVTVDVSDSLVLSRQ